MHPALLTLCLKVITSIQREASIAFGKCFLESPFLLSLQGYDLSIQWIHYSSDPIVPYAYNLAQEVPPF